MGSCLSSLLEDESLPSSPPSAKVISLNGDLHEYPVSLPVSYVLQAETSSAPSFFICNSDCLHYDDLIPPLDSDEQLKANQIYFVLSTSKLQRPLTTSDMAALAVKASVAIQNASTNNDKGTHRRKKARISPFVIVDQSVSESNDAQPQMTRKKSTHNPEDRPMQIPRSGSVKKLQRLTSRSKAMRAVRSFKLRMSTIYEGTMM